jgi:hypothetical protein
MQFTINETALADLADRYPVEDDHSAFLAIETAILGNWGDGADAVIQGGCEVAVDLLANSDGEIDGYRMLIHPSGDLSAPWIAGHIERTIDREPLPEPTEDGGTYDTAQIIRDAAQAASELLAWSER